MTRDDLFNTNASIVLNLCRATAKWVYFDPTWKPGHTCISQRLLLILYFCTAGHVRQPCWESFLTLSTPLCPLPQRCTSKKESMIRIGADLCCSPLLPVLTMCVCVCVCVYICVHVSMCVLCMCVCIFVCTCICVYMYVYLCVHVYVRVCLCAWQDIWSKYTGHCEGKHICCRGQEHWRSYNQCSRDWRSLWHHYPSSFVTGKLHPLHQDRFELLIPAIWLLSQRFFESHWSVCGMCAYFPKRISCYNQNTCWLGCLGIQVI